MLVLVVLLSEAFNLWPLRKPLGALRRRQADASQVVPLSESVRASAQLVCAPELQLPQKPRLSQSTDVPPVRLQHGSLFATVGGVEYELLRDAQNTVHASGTSDERGLFLDFAGVPNRGEHVASLGQLFCERFMAASRTKRWWMGPNWGSSAAEVPVETQVRLAAPHAQASRRLRLVSRRLVSQRPAIFVECAHRDGTRLRLRLRSFCSSSWARTRTPSCCPSSAATSARRSAATASA